MIMRDVGVVQAFMVSLIATCQCVKNEPVMYKMQNYTDCHQEKQGAVYCLFDFKLNSTVGKWQDDPLKLDRSLVHRMICVPKSVVDVGPFGVKILERELSQAAAPSIGIELLQVDCEREWNNFYFKWLFWITLLGYIALTLYCTKKDYYQEYVNEKVKPLLEAFSLTKNTAKLFRPNTNVDFQRLKSIQGVRVFNTIVVISFHTVLSLFQIYVDDIEQLEQDYRQPGVFYLMFVGAFSVQTFFLISSLLLTNQVLELRKKHGRFSMEHCAILVINRLFRFLPTLLLMLGLVGIDFFNGSPQTITMRNNCLTQCKHHWWHTMMQISFLLPFSSICTPGMWYLSVDTFFYVATLVILYVVLNYQLNIWKCVLGLAMGITIFFAHHLYCNQLNFMYQPYPEALKHMLATPEMTFVYIPPMASWCGSLAGILLGYIYFQNKHRNKINLNMRWRMCWWLTVVGLPIAAVHLATGSYQGTAAAIVGSVIKILFVCPLGVGLLGMAFGLGGVVKDLLESQLLVVLSNVTYCTYVFHFFIVFAKGWFLMQPLQYKANQMVGWFVADVAKSFAVGAICTVLVENPGLAVQKLFLPQIKREKCSVK